MKFTKMHGIGNDYVYVNCFEETVENPSAVARYVSDRHFGIGSDGLILIKPSKIADCEMDMYNLDGSQGAMCTCLFMMLISTVQFRMMSKSIIHMHGTTACYGKHITDSPLCYMIRYIIRYFLFHYACFLPFHLFSQTINLPDA